MVGQVLLFLGEEEFLKEEAIDKLRQRCGLKDQSSNNLSCQIFWAADEDFSVKKAIQQARVPCLFSPRQIILIKDIEKIKPAEREILLSYIAHPSNHTFLVLTSRTKQRFFPDPQFLAALLAKQPELELRDFRPLSEEEVRRRIVYWAKDRGKLISSRELDFILAKLGRDLARLHQAIERACLYAKDKPRLEQVDLEKVIGKEISLDVYRMFDAILDKDTAKALEILRGLNQFNVKPEIIIGTLARELRKLYKAKKFIRTGLSQSQIKTKLEIKYYADKFFAYLQKIRLEELEHLLKELLHIDIGIKTGRFKPYFGLESWILGSN